ncbi:hypothetical protein V8F20_001949 [Naviculisporaceae sp. PSN 640]
MPQPVLYHRHFPHSLSISFIPFPRMKERFEISLFLRSLRHTCMAWLSLLCISSAMFNIRICKCSGIVRRGRKLPEPVPVDSLVDIFSSTDAFGAVVAKSHILWYILLTFMFVPMVAAFVGHSGQSVGPVDKVGRWYSVIGRV